MRKDFRKHNGMEKLVHDDLKNEPLYHNSDYITFKITQDNYV